MLARATLLAGAQARGVSVAAGHTVLARVRTTFIDKRALDTSLTARLTHLILKLPHRTRFATLRTALVLEVPHRAGLTPLGHDDAHNPRVAIIRFYLAAKGPGIITIIVAQPVTRYWHE